MLLNLTTSLDGFIADRSGGIDWLPALQNEVPADYVELMATVDTLIMGRATYETSLALEGGVEIFEGKRVYVCSRPETTSSGSRGLCSSVSNPRRL